jgi:outer membrane protein TolC
MNLRISLAVLVFATSAASAQPKPRPATAPVATDDLAAFDREVDALFVKGGLTSDQAAARAPRVSPTVAHRIAEVEATIASATAAELNQVPQLGGNAVYTRLSPIAPLSLGPMFPPIIFLENSYVLEASGSVPLSDYVFRYPKLIDAAKLAESVAKYSKRASELSVGEDARLAYYEWVRARLQVLVAERQWTQVRATLVQVRALAEAQRLSKADLMRIEAQDAEAEQTVDQLKYLASLREEQLRLLIDAPTNEPLAIGEDIRADIPVPTTAPLDDMMRTATQQRVEFKVLDEGIKAKEKQREAELANEIPRLTAFGVMDYARPNPRLFPQKDEFDFTWSVGARVTWTINDTLISRTTMQRIRAETNQIRADRENLVRGTRIEVLQAQQALALAQHALVTSQKGLAAAEESYRVRKELLNADRATGVELVDAETDLTRARVTALNAHIDLRVAMAQLTHALGNDAR